MKILLLSILIVGMIGVMVPSAYATIFFPYIDYRTPEPPLYCIIEPRNLDDGEKFISLAEDAVDEWHNELREAALEKKLNPLAYKMESKVVSASEFSNSNCEIKISFSDVTKQDNSGKYGEDIFTLGEFRWISGMVNGEIEMFIQDVADDLIFVTLLHEIGHSLSLGHYASTDNDTINKWGSQNRKAPSMMIPVMNQYGSTNQKITNVDTEKIFDLYGKQGFYAFSKKTPPAWVPKITPPSTPTPKDLKIPLKPFDWIEIENSEIKLKKYETKIIEINGKINPDDFLRGHPVYILIIHPFFQLETLKIIPDQHGNFSAPILFDEQKYPSGIYTVESSYRSGSDSKMTFTFTVNYKYVDEKDVVYDNTSYFETTTYENENMNFSINFPSEFEISEGTSGDMKYVNFHNPTKGEFHSTSISYFENGFQYPDLSNNEQMENIISIEKNYQNELCKQNILYVSDNCSFGNITHQEIIVEDNLTKFYLEYFLEHEYNENSVQTRHEINVIHNNIPPSGEYWRIELYYVYDELTGNSPYDTELFPLLIESFQHTNYDIADLSTKNVTKIPEWIKNNAGWWAEGQIDDNSFVQGIQFMIKENIISIPNLPESSSETAESVPAWIKNNAGWWAEGQIDDNSFVKGIEYLVKVGIIQVT